MKNKIKTYFQLFWYTFQLSLMTFGGGYVIVSLMKKQFVDKLGWLDEKEMLDYTAIAQSSPGSIAVNASILIGYRLAGIIGVLISIAGTILPPLMILTAIAYGYTAFQSNIFIQKVLKGMQAGVAAVVVDVVLNLSSGVLRERNVLHILIMLASFVCVAFLHIHILLVILVCGLLGVGSTLMQKRRKGGLK